MGADGRTSYERRRGRSCKSIVVPIGETVHYKELGDGGDRENKAQSEWSKGVWLGPADRNTETLIGTPNGVVRAHTVERLSPSTKWDINCILDMRGTPQRPDSSKPGLHIPVRIRMDPDVLVQMPASRPARSPRSAYLSRDDFKRYGFTEGCEGCRRKSAGMAARPHSNKCRSRIEAEMRTTPEGRKRLEYSDMKVQEYLEKKLLADHGEADEQERPGISGGKAGSKQTKGVPEVQAHHQLEHRPGFQVLGCYLVHAALPAPEDGYGV